MANIDPIKKFKRIGVVGAGSMGSMMTFAFSEMGLDVSVFDVDKKNVDKVTNWAKSANDVRGKITGFYNVDEFTKSLEGGERKIFMFSITHGHPADSVLGMIKHDLKKGDIVLDGGNENYRRTERRQKECAEIGVSWIGMGVSGGYQSARRGPSLSPSGDAQALELIMPLLQRYAAKDPKSGTPCVTRIGPGGSGHFVKMVHNGIEGGMLSTLAEAWSFMHYGLGMGYEEIGDIFAQWDSRGELRGNFLINIGADILRTKRTPNGDGKGEGTGSSGFVLDDVLDKVVQDDDGSEGTPLWSLMESASRHVSCPTLAAAHYMRIASGNRQERVQISKKLQMPSPRPIQNTRISKEAMLEKLRKAVYCSFLSSFCQGLELISRASEDEGWNIDLGNCIQIWRAGCIIQSDYIADLLQPPLSGKTSMSNMKSIDAVSTELHNSFDALKDIVIEGTKTDQYLPAISATLDYLKYAGGLALPTKFMEAQMDYFGAHSYNKPGVAGEDPGPTHKGLHHYEWKVA
ncbi:6-phosphogluconate dehydrogenase decarboxylating [Penicillium longicatenatum]|uniref:6-phosphogluconate dehydrogenase decarboxylating n=1 Tax=Penicillium longicatenatum TaxID=1561947 RepID=UPI002547AF61|nr:6-phosphogluconate dehydrogenase decarboxylating [Penicillium longicatenatum]KAJ5650543.1 6-phosphogluconate dehydrogenase decarboxylating [Penicillium longicatenatum]